MIAIDKLTFLFYNIIILLACRKFQSPIHRWTRDLFKREAVFHLPRTRGSKAHFVRRPPDTLFTGARWPSTCLVTASSVTLPVYHI